MIVLVMRGILASLIYDDYISLCDIMSRPLSGDWEKAVMRILLGLEEGNAILLGGPDGLKSIWANDTELWPQLSRYF
jgi:hypothetical protein